jgi:hypothetical protein
VGRSLHDSCDSHPSRSRGSLHYSTCYSPVIIYCLDNSAFVCADNEGTISPIKKLEDGFYHVFGELVVAHEVTLAAAVSNLKRLVEVCGGRTVIIITLFLRYLNGYCCTTAGHCAHLAIQDAREKIFADLTRLHSFISNRLSSFPNCKDLAASDLLVNKAKAPTAEVEEAYKRPEGQYTAAVLPTLGRR